MSWIKTSEKMPEKGRTVFVVYENQVLRAMYLSQFFLKITASDDYFDPEYDKKTDEHYWREGWYEWNHIDDTQWMLESEKVTHWMLPPDLPKEEGRK